MSYIESSEEQVKELSPRFRLLYFVVVISAVVFVMRLWYLQIFMGTELRISSDQNRIKRQKLVAPRGMILDREGRVLVDNLPGFDVQITPQYARELEKTADEVGRILSIDPKQIVKDVRVGRRKDGAFKPVVIKRNLNRDEVARIERIRHAHPGLTVVTPIKRTYMLNEDGAQLFGYVGEIQDRQLDKLNENREGDQVLRAGDIIGQSGIEAQYDEILRGKDGANYVQVDAFGREAQVDTPDVLRNDTIDEPVPGHSLILTIDKDIQEAAYKAFVGTDRIGGLVAIDNRSGKILAWVSAPSFDPSLFWPEITRKDWKQLVEDPYKPLMNKLIQNHHSPGSTFKAVVALAALQEKVITPTTTHYCPGFIKFGRRVYHCHSRGGHGNVNIYQAIERSCNIFFFKMGMALGIDKMAAYAKALGIGLKTGIELPNEVPGLMPDTVWKKERTGEDWQPGENLSNAIGQGFVLTTPLQLATVFAGIANGGPVYKPYFVDKVVSVEGQVIKQNEPILLRDPSKKLNTGVEISPENYRIVQEGLWRVANGDFGTAKWYKIPGVEISGKSGTTQLINLSPDQVYVNCNTRPRELRHHGWFVGYAPYKHPEITVAVLAEHSCSGSGGAAPVVRDVIRAYMEKYHPEIFESKRVATKESHKGNL